MKIHHIGIVVNDVIEAADFFKKITNIESSTLVQNIESNLVKACFIPLKGEIQIEFIEPLNNKSPIFGFLKKGGGLHHICFLSDMFSEDFIRMKKVAKPLTQPVQGFDGRSAVFFFLRKEILGMRLIELAESNHEKG